MKLQTLETAVRGKLSLDRRIQCRFYGKGRGEGLKRTGGGEEEMREDITASNHHHHQRKHCNLKEHLSEFLRNHHEVNPQAVAIHFNLVDSDYPAQFFGKNRPIACSTSVTSLSYILTLIYLFIFHIYNAFQERQRLDVLPIQTVNNNVVMPWISLE